MTINLQPTQTPKDAGVFLADKIVKKLEEGKHVLWFTTGGSSIEVALIAADIIKAHPHQRLTVMLTDERYGDIDHPDSNWQQHLKKGFDLPEATLLPVLTGEDRQTTTQKYSQQIATELTNADFKIGLFGIGADGHTAGILPQSEAVESGELACDYTTEAFERITITPKTILQLDEAVVFMQGKAKWPVIEKLETQMSLLELPAQILKQVPTLTIFSDYQKD